jgi:predicted DNA-binding transcriptional regulator AlpA
MPKIQTSLGQLPVSGFIRQSQLIPGIVPFSSSTLWRKVNAGDFPKPVRLSERITAWPVQDIRDWIEKQNNKTVGGARS